MKPKKTSVKCISVFLCIFCIILFISQSYANHTFNNYATELFFNYNPDFANGSVYEWRIHNVKASNPEEMPFNNSDILSMEIVVDFQECNFTSGPYGTLHHISPRPYKALINGEELSSDQNDWLFYSMIPRYQYIFGLRDPFSLNIYDPIYFYPLEYVNGSDTMPYFDLFYDALYQIASGLETWDVTKSKNGKYIEIKESYSKTQSDSEYSRESVLSINTEVGILSSYKYDYEDIDKLNSSNSEYLSFEISSRTYRAGYESLELILLSSISIICMTYLWKRRKKKL